MSRCAEKKGKGRCIVPVDANGKHVDGNPDHYAGQSHWVGGVWLRG